MLCEALALVPSPSRQRHVDERGNHAAPEPTVAQLGVLGASLGSSFVVGQAGVGVAADV